jgi:hypothetical protein
MGSCLVHRQQSDCSWSPVELALTPHSQPHGHRPFKQLVGGGCTTLRCYTPRTQEDIRDACGAHDVLIQV